MHDFYPCSGGEMPCEQAEKGGQKDDDRRAISGGQLRWKAW